jgi:hypothetical protein
VGKSKFIDETDGGFFIAAAAVDPTALNSVLAYYGQLREVSPVKEAEESGDGVGLVCFVIRN